MGQDGGPPGAAGASPRAGASLLENARRRGVLRAGASYLVIAWLLLQIADVVFEPLGLPAWGMTALIVAAAIGFPVALLLAWFYEIGDHRIELDTAPAEAVRPTAHGIRRYADVIVIGVLLLTVAVLLVRQSDLGKPKPPENPAIAVLPFENLGGDPEQEYFSDGLAEEMLDRLGRVPGLKVIARSSSFGFKGQDVDLRTVAERLGVTTLLEGSVRRDGRRLRLSARLVDGKSGQQVWSGSFDRELNDVFAVQAELAAAVVEAVAPAARGAMAEDEPAPTSDLNAYDLYLIAKTQLVIRGPEAMQKSVELSEQAVRLDPGFARAHALLAAGLLFQRLYAADHDAGQAETLLRRAESTIHRALALDPDLSEAHGAYANLLRDTERPGAEEQYKRALELNPNNATAWHDYGVYLTNKAGRPLDGDVARERSLELDPRQPVTWANHLRSVLPEGRDRYEAERARALRAVGDMPGAMRWLAPRIWADDRASYRQAVVETLDGPGIDGDALDGLTFPDLILGGFPVEIMLIGTTKERRSLEGRAPPWAFQFRAWQFVDPARAGSSIPEHGKGVAGVEFSTVRLVLLAEVAGLEGDWSALDEILDEIGALTGEDDPRLNSVAAFWLAVQDRFDEAARALALIEPVPEESEGLPPLMGSDARWGLMEVAQLRILRGTKRNGEAEQLARLLLERRRSELRAAGLPCQYGGEGETPVRAAGLFASEGLKDEAVVALQRAMACSELPFGFWPALPWFKALEGYPPYDEILGERRRRVDQIRAELERLATAG